MKIKVALLDKDKEYLDRLTGVFNTKYADKYGTQFTYDTL